MEKVFVAQRVAKKLWDTEAKIDAAIREAAELMTDVLQAPVDIQVSPTVVDAPQAKIVEALKALSEARTAMVAAHHMLDETRLRVGIRTKMLGYQKFHLDVERVRMEAETNDVQKVG